MNASASWRLCASIVLAICAGIVALAPVRASEKLPKNSDWNVLGGNAEAQHYSALDQINGGTVGKLGLAWYADIPSLDGLVGNPLVEDGIVYQSGGLARVFANDIRTGKLLWEYSPDLDFSRNTIALWANRFNRGLAIWKDKVIVGTGDCRLIAVNRKTGKVMWSVLSCDPAKPEGITGAPRVGGGMVFIGNTCGDAGGARGFVDAFDAETGAHKWRFYTVPSGIAGENDTAVQRKAAATWGTDGLKSTKGGGSAWDALTYDPTLNLLYIGVDGAAPWNPKARAPDAGDELFTTAIVAVNADTGAYVWHYTTTPHDAWNFDATMHLLVADLRIDGGKRRVVMQAGKNGFFYVLDAKNGKLLRANNFAHVNWASHIDMKTGRPVELPDARYFDGPDYRAVVFPGPAGAHNWHAMSYDARRGLVYIPVQEIPTLVTITDAPDASERAGVPRERAGGDNVSFDLLYGLHDPKYRDQLYGELVAWDPIANRSRWRARHVLPINGGTLATGGNLVFQGTGDGQFLAYDSTTGKQLWNWQGDGAIQSAPTTVTVDGSQYLLVASGNAASANLSTYTAALTTTEATRGPSRLLAFKLGGVATLPTRLPTARFERPSRPRFPKETAHLGQLLFEFNSCVVCHGDDAISAGGTIPDLRRLSDVTYGLLNEIVVGGLYKPAGMPPVPEMTKAEVAAIGAYLTNEAWSAYDEQERKAKTLAK